MRTIEHIMNELAEANRQQVKWANKAKSLSTERDRAMASLMVRVQGA